MAFSPRKRAKRETPTFGSWPDISEGPKIQGFAGYKAGMSHAIIVDYRPTSTTAGQEIQVPVTVIETPPMKVAAVRFYQNSPRGLKTVCEVWHKNINKELRRRFPIPKNFDVKEAWKRIDVKQVDDVRVITYTQPRLASGVPKKAPEIMENRIGGGTIQERIQYAKSILGKEVKIGDFAKEGDMIDVVAVTKGKGFGGHRKRWGTKLLSHKDSKHRRKIGTTGSFTPGRTRSTVPQAGQVGYHQRTEHNKRVLKIGENGQEVTPRGGFLSYGLVKSGYVLLHGSVPGPSKRLIRMRDAIRQTGVRLEEPPKITYFSMESKQGA